MNLSTGSLVALVISLTICFAAAALGARVTTPEIPTWYASLAKPSWTPPRAAFPIVWPILYLLMAVAAWLLWIAPPSPARTAALIGFAAQLTLNAVWSPVFFGRHDLTGGLVIISLLVVVLTFTIAMAFEVAWLPGVLLVPYLIWISFAAALNFRIWTLN
ncbi:TspO/MBR family protein [Tardiphaga sp.]|jgi:benzodiazapine receptor|uniref:TspO/MBR family protein n=1 Tax=Tardiphaga sp. TaxID=1926292 RepID=UPI0037D9B90E